MEYIIEDLNILQYGSKVKHKYNKIVVYFKLKRLHDDEQCLFSLIMKIRKEIHLNNSISII